MTLVTVSDSVRGGEKWKKKLKSTLAVNLSFLFIPVQAQEKETCLRYQKMKPSNIATPHYHTSDF